MSVNNLQFLLLNYLYESATADVQEDVWQDFRVAFGVGI